MQTDKRDRGIWRIYRLGDDGQWTATSRYQYYRKLQDALQQKALLSSGPKSKERYEVFGFSSENAVKLVLRSDEAAGRTVEATTSRYLHEFSKSNVRKTRPPASQEAPLQLWDLIKSWIRNGQLDLARLFDGLGYRTVDKRPKGGCLWIVGDSLQLKELMSLFTNNVGIRFRFKPEGGKASRYQPAWFVK